MSIGSKISPLLSEAGLSEAEIMIYLDLLKAPASTKWDLIARTKFGKNKVYRAFEKLEQLNLVEKNDQGIRALSLKTLVADLFTQERKRRKLAFKIKKIAPYLRVPNESIEEFETLYSSEQIADAYMFMSERPYDTNFDFGDFENFVDVINDIDLAWKFRNRRMKRAKAHSILTNFGPRSAEFCHEDELKRCNAKLDLPNIDFKDNFIIFSDTDDYVLFNNFSDPEFQSSVLLKSRAVADAQRASFKQFSQLIENI